jgi:hypothetical protein
MLKMKKVTWLRLILDHQIWKLKETIQNAENLLGLDISAIVPAPNGKQNIGLANGLGDNNAPVQD